MRPRIKKYELAGGSRFFSRPWAVAKSIEARNIENAQGLNRALSIKDMMEKYGKAAEEAREEGLSGITAEMQDAVEREYAAFCTVMDNIRNNAR